MPSLRDASFLSIALFIVVLMTSPWVAVCTAQEPDTQEGPGVWAQFRGDGTGLAEQSELPYHWTLERGIRWRTELPDGIAQPIVSGDRIFVAAGRWLESGEMSRVMIGLDKATGEVVWETGVFAGPEEKLHYQFSSVAMATPATDGDTIFAYFGPRLAALDRDGKLLWNHVIDEGYWQRSRYGAATSPVLADDKVIVLRDMEHGDEAHAALGWPSWLAAFSQQDGSELWRTEWTGTCCSYATPNIIERPDGSKQVLVTSGPKIMGFDLETGAELWAIDYPAVQPVPSSTLVDKDFFIASGAVHARLTAGFRVTGSGSETQVERVWTDGKGVPEIASPVVYQGTLYQVTENGVASALDAETGKPLRRWRLPRGPYRASMIASDGKIFALSARGIVSVWKPRPSFEIIGTHHLPGDTGPYLAMAATEDCLLFRARKALYCVDGFVPEPEAEEPAAAEPEAAEAPTTTSAGNAD